MKTCDISIAINGSMLDDHPTGVGIYTVNIINYLERIYQKDRSKKITVFTASSKLLDKNVKTIEITSLVKSSTYGKLAALSRFLWNTFLYPLKAKEYDLLISLTTHGSFFSKNQILTIHDLISLKYENINSHQRFYFKHLLPYLVKRAKLILTVSESSKEDIVTYLKCEPEKIKVVYNGYNNQLYKYQPEKGTIISGKYGVSNYLLAVGPTYPHKNFETLINAYSHLDAAIKVKFPLLIAGGKANYLQKLKQLVSDLKLTQYIHFAGYVPGELMPNLYNEAFALIFPSLHEGFGIPLLEAMASGCPIIASTASSIKEVCGNAALYFDPHDIKQLTNTMLQLINSNSMYENLVRKGIVRAPLFTWEESANSLNTIIENQTKPPCICLT